MQLYTTNDYEAGCDEAGRGCLAGPVFAAAVILPEGYKNSFIRDSKTLSAQQRELVRREIEKDALAWSIGKAEIDEIDSINILNASILAMHRALAKLIIQPRHILVDGNRFNKFGNIPHTCIVKGDSLFLSIAAASVLAKTYRDDFMVELHEKFPVYNWAANKGYPTAFHADALCRHGPSPLHRKSFRLKSAQIPIDFPDVTCNTPD
jgi:ribonuclease HII